MNEPEDEPRLARGFRVACVPADHQLQVCAAFWPPVLACKAMNTNLLIQKNASTCTKKTSHAILLRTQSDPQQKCDTIEGGPIEASTWTYHTHVDSTNCVCRT